MGQPAPIAVFRWGALAEVTEAQAIDDFADDDDVEETINGLENEEVAA